MTRFSLPSTLSTVLRPHIAPLAGEIGEAVEAAGYGFDPEVLRFGIGEGLRVFVDEVELGRPERERRVFFNFGRTEMRAGRPLAEIHAAYRLSGRLAWRRWAAAGREAGVDAAVLHDLAEALFAWIDELCDQTARGYEVEARAATSAAQLRRDRAVRLIVADPPADAATVRAAAAQVPWPLPARLAICAAADESGGLAAALGPEALAAPRGALLCVVLADPDAPGRLDALARLAADRGAVVARGPTVARQRAALSWARARATHELIVRGAIASRPLVDAADHPELLVLAADPDLARELRDGALAPLADLTDKQRARFAATLRCWLAHRGALKEISAELGVHPQTVRYRVARLRELFGDALDDPAARFRLELALRASTVV